MEWSWIPANGGLIWQLARENAYLGIVPALIGLAISLPLGMAAAASPETSSPRPGK